MQKAGNFAIFARLSTSAHGNDCYRSVNFSERCVVSLARGDDWGCFWKFYRSKVVSLRRGDDERENRPSINWYYVALRPWDDRNRVCQLAHPVAATLSSARPFSGSGNFSEPDCLLPCVAACLSLAACRSSGSGARQRLRLCREISQNPVENFHRVSLLAFSLLLPAARAVRASGLC